MEQFPEHLILPDKVYQLSVSRANGGRAFDRGLVDFYVKGINPLSASDTWSTLLGMSEELYEDYPSFKQSIPLNWLLLRFLCHHVRSNSLDILSGHGGEVLTTKTFQDYLGREPSDHNALQILLVILGSWVRAFPEKRVVLRDIYVSTDLTIEILKRAINTLKFAGHIEDKGSDEYIIKPGVFSMMPAPVISASLDRQINRYYQEVAIQAIEPFCFVLMPFREEELPQRIYTEVIKPLVENVFKISCYRVDEDHLPDRIDNKIYTYLLRAAFIIVEVSTLNPNVFYELGLAHMLEKSCIILTQTPVSQVPFDINRIRAEHYANDEQLVHIIKQSISALAFKGK